MANESLKRRIARLEKGRADDARFVTWEEFLVVYRQRLLRERDEAQAAIKVGGPNAKARLAEVNRKLQELARKGEYRPGWPQEAETAAGSMHLARP